MSDKKTYLKEMLYKKMSEANLSAHALEKQAGLKRSAVQNILYGKSKKPSAEILGAITKVLGCSIDDLLNKSNQPSTKTVETDNSALDALLYSKAAQITHEILAAQSISPTKSELLSYIDEIYQYATSNHLREIDVNFAVWLAKKQWPAL